MLGIGRCPLDLEGKPSVECAGRNSGKIMNTYFDVYWFLSDFIFHATKVLNTKMHGFNITFDSWMNDRLLCVTPVVFCFTHSGELNWRKSKSNIEDKW
jgi:hypothetical protein